MPLIYKIKYKTMLKEILYYILKKEWSLPNSRLTKLVYLLDWKYSLEQWKQYTNIKWYFDYYWPFVKDIEKIIEENPDWFKTNIISDIYWNKKYFSINWNHELNLSDNLKNYINSIIYRTSKLSYSWFIKFVYSTYPIYKSKKFEYLELEKLAKEYNQYLNSKK